MGEEGVDEGVSFCGCGGVACEEGEGDGAIEKVAEGEEGGGRVWEGEGEKGGDQLEYDV